MERCANINREGCEIYRWQRSRRNCGRQLLRVVGMESEHSGEKLLWKFLEFSGSGGKPTALPQALKRIGSQALDVGAKAPDPPNCRSQCSEPQSLIYDAAPYKSPIRSPAVAQRWRAEQPRLAVPQNQKLDVGGKF